MNDMIPPHLPPEDQGRLVENIMHFGRVLRIAGLPVGPGKVIDAIRATECVGITNREDFYWALHAVFVNRADQREIFDQAFHIFWKNPRILERMMQMVLPEFRGENSEKEEDAPNRRVAEALAQAADRGSDDAETGDEIEFDAALTYSPSEVLQTMDFEKMSQAEVAQALAAIKDMRLPIMDVPTRRYHPAAHGNRADLRATMRAVLRSGGDVIPLKKKKRIRRHPPLVILCDISGSMAKYSRMLLHFMHALTNDRDRVHTFLFGTRLSNVSRYLRHKDIDEALEKIGETVTDWSGGTRIGHCLHEFNNTWSRRVLGQGAVILMISDGLDRDAGTGLEDEMERLHKSCRRLIWLNPLLRYDGFEPRSMGVRAMIPHVDEFRTAHSLDSLEQLADLLSKPVARRRENMSTWSKRLDSSVPAQPAMM